jgi:hypothetical protein
MKIYRLILILEEDFIRGLKETAEITISEFKRKILNSYKASQVYESQLEDILIGEELTLENIKDRFSYYSDLSHTKLGKLELVICSSNSNLNLQSISLFKEQLDKETIWKWIHAFESDFFLEIKYFNSLRKVLLLDEKGQTISNKSLYELNLDILKSYNKVIAKRT